MGKLTNSQKEHFKQLVLDCIIQRLTTEGSLLFIKDRLALEISEDYFNHVRASLKKNAEKNLRHIQKDRFAFIQGFFDRMEEIKFMQKKIWEIVNNNKDKPNLQLSCLSQLHQLTITFSHLDELLPAVSQTGPFANNNYTGFQDYEMKGRLNDA